MTIRIGTLQEMTGTGLEILVDEETRSILLAKFFDGNLIRETSSTGDGESETVVSAS